MTGVHTPAPVLTAPPERQDPHSLLRLFLAAFFLLLAGIFVWSQSTPGVLDRYQKIRGRDFLQFYLAGQLVADRQADKLYDQEYFFQRQTEMSPVDKRNPRYFSLYPPTVALIFSPLARLNYGNAIVVWWGLQILIFTAAIALLLRGRQLSRSEKKTAWIVAATFYPLCLAILNGQLVPILLLAIVVGFSLRDHGQAVLGGLVLSLLCIKPQFAAGMVIWLCLRHDFRSLFGLALGIVFQMSGVAAILGTGPLFAYAHNLRLYAELSGIYRFSPDYEHSLAGILTNILGDEYRQWYKLPHFALAAFAAYLIWRMPRSADRNKLPSSTERVEGAAESATAILFVLLFTPHLLIYDLSLLLAPILWLSFDRENEKLTGPSHNSRWLYAAGMLPPIYLATRFSITPLLLLYILWRLAKPMQAHPLNPSEPIR